MSDPTVGSSRRGLFLILSVKMRDAVSEEWERLRRVCAGCDIVGADGWLPAGRGEDAIVLQGGLTRDEVVDGGQKFLACN